MHSWLYEVGGVAAAASASNATKLLPAAIVAAKFLYWLDVFVFHYSSITVSRASLQK